MTNATNCIRALRNEAAEHGDGLMAIICDILLDECADPDDYMLTGQERDQARRMRIWGWTATDVVREIVEHGQEVAS